MHRLRRRKAELISTAATSQRVVYDRVTLQVYCQLACYGYFVYGFGPTIALLRDDQGVSRAVSGLHGTVFAMGALLVGVFGATLTLRLGRGVAMWTGLTVLCIGVVAYTGPPLLSLTVAGALVAGIGGSFVVNGSSAILSDHQAAAGPASISQANALAAALGVTAPLVIGVAVAADLGWRVGLLVTLALVGAVAIAFGRVRIPTALPQEDRSTPGRRRLPGRYWWAWCVLATCIAVEFCFTFWASELLRSRAGLAPGAAAAGVTVIVAGMLVGRLAGGRLALRFAVDPLLLASLAVAAAGFALFWWSASPLPALAGLLVAGLGIALQYPLGVARAIAASDGHPDLATARGGIAAGLAIGAGPFVLGALADVVGTHAAFLLVPVLLALAAVFVRLGPTLTHAPIEGRSA
jgi:predicted MFS family arabinose efflux permease